MRIAELGAAKNASLAQKNNRSGRSVRLSVAKMSRRRCGIEGRTIEFSYPERSEGPLLNK
jgi:hypothetical protein